MSGAPADLEPVSILLVDDRPNNLRSLAAALRRPDYEVVLATSGAGALAHILRRDFAVILLDVAMPGMDGFETARIIKQREQSKLIPIIFITASVYDMEHVFRGYKVGAVDYLRKPADPHQVRSKVAVFAQLYRQRKEIERQARRLHEAERREQEMLRGRVEAALRHSEALYQHTFDEAPIGIGHANVEGRWLGVNRKLCEILGRSCEELVGTSVARIVADDDVRRLADVLGRLERHEQTLYREEHRLAAAPGVEAWGRIVISRLPAVVGPTLVVIVEDVTDRRTAESERSTMIRRLEQTIRVRDDFLSIAAHELKTPLTPLRLQTSTLVREARRGGAATAASPRLLERLERIDASAARLEDLVERLLDLSRLSVGTVTLEVAEVDLRAIVEGVVARLGREARRSGSELSIDAPAPVVGTWDRLRLEQVVATLLSNAFKYGGGKPIEVSIRSDGERATLTVKDHGIGVPLAEQGRIFERFDRLSPVRNYGGFGIGLWVAREVVEAHGGRIVVSSHPGAGASFTVELPRVAVATTVRGIGTAREVA